MIRIDAVWLATAPMDMRAGTDTALARVVAVFGAAHPYPGACQGSCRLIHAANC
ncbi:MAG: family insertion sequence element accessory protein TnpB [Pseudomonadota bacterium]